MSDKRLIIHPGFHKSGTTALQESFALNRALLREHGILYPRIGTKAHHRVAWALTQRPWVGISVVAKLLQKSTGIGWLNESIKLKKKQ